MEMGDAPLVRRSLALELQELRENAGLSIAEAASSIGISRESLWRIERARVLPRQPTVDCLSRLYGASDDQVARLLDLRRGGKEESRRGTRSRVIAPEWALYTAALRDAKALRVWEPELIPGLLQLPEYLAALQELHRTAIEPAAAMRSYRARQQTEFFQRRRRRRAEFLLGVGVLRNLDRRPELQQAQVKHILALVQAHGIDVRVTSDLHVCMYGSFHVLTPGLSGLGGPTFAYVESIDAARYFEEAQEVSRFVSAHQEAFKLATPIEEWI